MFELRLRSFTAVILLTFVLGFSAIGAPSALANAPSASFHAQSLKVADGFAGVSIAGAEVYVEDPLGFDDCTYLYDGTEHKPAVSVELGDGFFVENGAIVNADYNYRIDDEEEYIDDEEEYREGYYDDSGVWHDAEWIDPWLEEGVDYEVSYSNNVDAGTASVHIDGIGIFTGSITKHFTIEPRTLSGRDDSDYYGTEVDYDTLTIKGYPFESADDEYADESTLLQYTTYSGIAKEPAVSVTDGSLDKTLVKGVDYRVSYKNNLNAGIATVKVTGIGNYDGTLKKKFRINRANMKRVSVSGLKNIAYTGKAIKQKPVVKLKRVALSQNKDYTLEYKKNVLPGTATVVVKGKRNCQGSLTATFNILPLGNLSKAKVLGVENKKYNGKKLTQKPVVKLGVKKLVQGRDYRLAYRNNKVAGCATLIVQGKGGYVGSISKQFSITARLTKGSIVKVRDAVYTGKKVAPVLTIKTGGRKLVEGEDYVVSCKKNVKPGKAVAVIKGKGLIGGKAKVAFRVVGKMSDARVKPIKGRIYTGKRIAPKPVVTFADRTLKLGRDYKLLYKNNVKPGRATVIIVGKGYYKGKTSVEFSVKKIPLKNVSISEIGNRPLSGLYGGEVGPKFLIKYAGKKLKLDRDYELSYLNNRYYGTATVIIKGCGVYSGTIKRKFDIVADLSKANIFGLDLEISDGTPKEPRPTVWTEDRIELELGREYTLSYRDNVSAGKAKVIITGKGRYFKGSKEATFRIVQGGEGHTATLAEYNRIEIGMTYSQVVAVIGGKGKLAWEHSGYYTHYKTYTWDIDAAWGDVTVEFEDGYVSSKRQYGL